MRVTANCSLYWTVITGTTVGFGDRSPHQPGVRLASVFFLPFAVAVLGEFLGRVANAYLERKHIAAERKFFEKSMTLADLEIMDTNKDGVVDRAEFLAHMLVTLQVKHPDCQNVEEYEPESCHTFSLANSSCS